MTPLRNPQTRPERRYNFAQIRTRNTVERMFGVWKRMLPCLSQTLCTKLGTTLTIIMATAVLSNFVRGRNDPVDEPIDLPVEDEAVYIEPAGEGRMGNAVRQTLIQQHFT